MFPDDRQLERGERACRFQSGNLTRADLKAALKSVNLRLTANQDLGRLFQVMEQLEWLLDNIESLPWQETYDWDRLFGPERTPEERLKCLSDCEKTCSDGNKAIGTVATLVLAFGGPAGWAGDVAVWAGLEIWENLCKRNCPERCKRW